MEANSQSVYDYRRGSRVADFWERFHRAEKLNALYKINNINIKKLTL